MKTLSNYFLLLLVTPFTWKLVLLAKLCDLISCVTCKLVWLAHKLSHLKGCMRMGLGWQMHVDWHQFLKPSWTFETKIVLLKSFLFSPFSVTWGWLTGSMVKWWVQHHTVRSLGQGVWSAVSKWCLLQGHKWCLLQGHRGSKKTLRTS